MARKHDPITKYAKWAIRSHNKVGKLGRLAAERHLRDLDEAKDKGFYFDLDAALMAIDFFPAVCRHSKGEWAGERVDLTPNQQFRIGSVFGWKKIGDDMRRYRTAYNTESRKNGKSTLSAGVGLYMMTADGEGGADCYSYATKRDQARIVFDEAKMMTRKSPALKSRLEIQKLNLAMLSTASKFEPLSADENSLDGLNPHCAIGDEIHAHKSRAVYDVLETAMGSRRQSLHWLITTRGVSHGGVCEEVDEYSIKVLKGEVPDDSWFAYIACLDEDDEWDNEATWIKANPNLGVSVKLDDLQRLAIKAKYALGARAEFKKKRCNLWISSVSEWLDGDAWRDCGGLQFDEEDLKGQECYGGLDLSGSKDLTSFQLLFEDIDGKEKLLSYFWLPEKGLEERSQEENVPWTEWANMGVLRTTPGAAINKAYVAREIAEICSQFDVKVIGYDRWRINELIQEFDDIGFQTIKVKEASDLDNKENRYSTGTPIMEWGQGFRDMSPAVDEVEGAVADNRLRHGDNPILTYCVSNVAVSTDPAGNRKLDKSKSRSRIDGAIGMAMAYGVRARMSGAVEGRTPLTADQIFGVIG